MGVLFIVIVLWLVVSSWRRLALVPIGALLKFLESASVWLIKTLFVNARVECPL